MSDGAHLGVNASRALETILGGKKPPASHERENQASVLERVLHAPSPATNPRPRDYGTAADAVAKAFLSVLDDNPSLPLTADVLWDAVKEKWPDFDEWLGGATGFMVGWAVNCVRWLREQPPVPNPAILTIG